MLFAESLNLMSLKLRGGSATVLVLGNHHQQLSQSLVGAKSSEDRNGVSEEAYVNESIFETELSAGEGVADDTQHELGVSGDEKKLPKLKD